MKPPLITLILLVASALALDAQQTSPPVQSFAAAPGQTFNLDLDTPEARFSQWRHDELGSISALRATLRIPLIRQDPRWFPVFSIRVQRNELGGKSGNDVALQILARDRKVPLSVQAVEREGGRVVETQVFSKTIGLDEAVDVEMEWNSINTVTIKVGDEIRKMSVSGWRVDSVVVSASTGEMTIDPLVFGSVGP